MDPPIPVVRPRDGAGAGGPMRRAACVWLMALATVGCETRIVNPIPATGITMNPTSVTMIEGESRTLVARLVGPSGQVLQGRPLTWTTEPTGVVSVSSQGVLTTLSPGSTAVRASAEGFEASAAVTVLQGPTLVLDPTALAFAAPAGQDAPMSAAVSVTNSGSGEFQALSRTVMMTDGAEAGWLTASLSGGSAPATLTIDASSADLAPGTYLGSVTVSDAAARNGSQRVEVELEVAEALPTIALSTTTVQFSANAGTLQAASQDIAVTNGGGGSLEGLSAEISPASATAWLDAAFTGGTVAPSVLELSASAAALAGGSYSATVTVRSASASDPVTVQVTFDVN